MVLHAFAEGTFKAENLLQFLDYNKFPLVTIVTDLNLVRVYSSPIKSQVIVISELFFIFRPSISVYTSI